MATKKQPQDRKPKTGKHKDQKGKGGAVPGMQTDDQPVIYRFTLDGKKYEMDVNPDHLPVGERIEIENYLEMPLLEAIWSGWLSSSKASAFLCYLAWRKVDEDEASLEKVLNSKELLVEEINEDDQGKEDEAEEPEPSTSSETPDDSGDQS